MIAIFVHGWSVRHTETYGALPQWLQNQGGLGGGPIQVGNVYLGKYVSFDDAVTVDDLARAFHQAVRDELAAKLRAGERFACITHSTGGPVIRKWMDLYYRRRLARCPLSHLVMLAPANHGSALAQLGKSRLSRLKFALQGAECGERVLDWLELGSDGQWNLNTAWLEYDCVGQGIYPFVLTGQRIDRKLYDALNSYTGEAGSDGVVRACAANLNYGKLRLAQRGRRLEVDRVRRTARTAFGVLPGQAHSGERMGIIRSVRLDNADQHPTAQWVLRCLRVGSAAGYARVRRALDQLTRQTQEAERVERVRTLFGSRRYRTDRYAQIVFRLVDDRGEALSDYDLYLTAGPHYSEDDLPPGFFVDRQRNKRNPGKLTYYLNADVMHSGLRRPALEGRLGLRVVVRPESGLAYYQKLDFRTSLRRVAHLLVPNETLMVEIEMQRKVDKTVFRISPDLTPSPIDPTPSGQLVR